MKNTETILLDNNMYICSLDEFIEIDPDLFYMLYSPLSTMAIIASATDLKHIADYISKKSDKTSEAVKEIVDALLDQTPAQESWSYKVHSVDDFVNMSILPNNTCNFRCSYCYSAQGRSISEISRVKLFASIDYFIDSQRTKANQLYLSIFGGGEPLLSWDLLKDAIPYAIQRANTEKIKLNIELITNGSILTDEIIDLIVENKINITISFEILESVQNAQRKHFDCVSQHVKRLLERGVIPSINSVITCLNVNRQVEMIEEVAYSYPKLDYLSFEPLIDLNNQKSSAIDDKFYTEYTQHFFEALDVAKSLNINLSCSVMRNVDCIVDRYCSGEFAVCADGSITVCPCVSSSDMTNYDCYLYGSISEEGIVNIDNKKLDKLLNKSVHDYPTCKYCIAKWNCAGGCANSNSQESKKSKHAKCNFTREFTKQVLWKRLKKEYENEYNTTIEELLKQTEYESM